MPSTIWSCWESPELESLPVPLAFVCEGFDAEDTAVAEVTSPFESVAICEDELPGARLVVAPVALATGTSTEPAVTVVVDVARESPSATLPHINMTAGTAEPAPDHQ